jgi:hypothetical protein
MASWHGDPNARLVSVYGLLTFSPNARCANPALRHACCGFGRQGQQLPVPLGGGTVAVLAALGEGGGVSLAEERVWIGQEAMRRVLTVSSLACMGVRGVDGKSVSWAGQVDRWCALGGCRVRWSFQAVLWCVRSELLCGGINGG